MLSPAQLRCETKHMILWPAIVYAQQNVIPILPKTPAPMRQNLSHSWRQQAGQDRALMSHQPAEVSLRCQYLAQFACTAETPNSCCNMPHAVQPKPLALTHQCSTHIAAPVVSCEYQAGWVPQHVAGFKMKAPQIDLCLNAGNVTRDSRATQICLALPAQARITYSLLCQKGSWGHSSQPDKSL
jgi:hypothetical protein